MHCFVSLSCDPCICKTILTAHAPAYSCAKLYFIMNENLKTALEDSYTLGCHWNLNRQIIWYIIASLVLLINYTTCNIMHIHSSWNWMLFTIAWTKSPELAQTQAFHYRSCLTVSEKLEAVRQNLLDGKSELRLSKCQSHLWLCYSAPELCPQHSTYWAFCRVSVLKQRQHGEVIW